MARPVIVQRGRMQRLSPPATKKLPETSRQLKGRCPLKEVVIEVAEKVEQSYTVFLI